MAQRSSYHYRPRGDDQADLEKRVKEIAETRVRYGYRHIYDLLRCEGLLSASVPFACRAMRG